MSLEDHKAKAQREIQMWASNNSGTPEDFAAENYINHQEPYVEGGDANMDLAAWQDLLRGYHDGFSNSKVEVSMQIAEGDLVATKWQITATQTGDYVGFAPTGKEVTWTGVQISRFENGMIVESWVDWDKYSLLHGLGLVE